MVDSKQMFILIVVCLEVFVIGKGLNLFITVNAPYCIDFSIKCLYIILSEIQNADSTR